MPLNLQERHQSLTIPAGWSLPEFSLGQIVRWKIINPHLKVNTVWGQIIGFSWWESYWSYEVLVSPNCPMGIAYPKTWGTGDCLEILSVEELLLMTE